MTSSRTSIARPIRVLVKAVLATAGILVPSGTASTAPVDSTVPTLTSISVSGTPARPGQTIALDLGAATFAVFDSAADYTPPRLTSVRLTGSPMLPGGTATLPYAVESQDPIAKLAFKYDGPFGYTGVFETGSAAPRQSSPA